MPTVNFADLTNPAVRVLSFGYGHDLPPGADITVDVRGWFRDPHVSPAMRSMTGLDAEVHANVVATSGVVDLVAELHRATAVLVGLNHATVTVAIGCVGGRHRSVVLANLLAEQACSAGWSVEVDHLHVDRPVLTSTRTHS
jgi:RNase adaptor protein for sRNA GlmZ degradation